MKVRFWGVRGSIAAPGKQTLRYGGNTSCVSVTPPGRAPIIIDAGTGLRTLGKALVDQTQNFGGFGQKHEDALLQGGGDMSILVSHTHWDHVQGLPFFAPFQIAGNRFHIYARERHDDQLQAVFGSQLSSTYFPEPLAQFRADVEFRELRDDSDFMIGDVRVRCARLNHPWIAVAYRLDWQGTSVTYCSDTAPFRDILLEHDFVKDAPPAGYRPDARALARLQQMQTDLRRLCHKTDLLIYDTQFTTEEYATKPHWGHSTPEDAIELAVQSDVKNLCLFHHAPLRNDDEQDAIVTAARATATARGYDLQIAAAWEGLEIDLTAPRLGDLAPSVTFDRGMS